MPEKQFLIAGHNPESIDFSQYPNVTYMPWENDPSKFYSKTKTLLVPSIWPEPFGRVCVEAGFCGIPVIASRIGGLPEVVGEGGILIREYGSPEKWIEAIESIEVEKIYKELSGKTRVNAQKFTVENTLDGFRKLARDSLGMEI